MSRGAALAGVLDDCASLAIVCHDNPDPDTLASALALESIALERDVTDVVIVYGGEISHQQNRAFVTQLELDVEPLEHLADDDYECLAFVDHSRHGATTSLSSAYTPDIVVDHHPGDPVDTTFVDVRTDYGATATIFVEYLLDLDIEPSTRLASALLFALHRERLDFVRDPTRREYEAALAVYPEADLEILGQLYGSAFSPATIDAIGRAITSRKRRGSSVVASVGRTPETDALPQAADYLLNIEGVDTVLTYGVIGDRIRLSGRSIDPRIDVGSILESAYGDLGSAGGHHDMAGGRIDLGLFVDETDDDDLLQFVDRRVTRRFFEALNLDAESETGV
ncbi:DHH family phosphoesterase [Natronosalvus vescus]|uniref:DHH family phosphoesterase n=1 Tax=Natronosalvus vescus TaxID=2953881 RepID=UPI002090C7F8|nr:bifunctional oligoribonuclease/PAP phosphatase NrnA [Natronosalvus vescus]